MCTSIAPASRQEMKLMPMPLVLKTGVTPSASGSAYLELDPQSTTLSPSPTLASHAASGLKLTCTVHGPRPLPRSAPFSPHLILTTHIKYAPFAARQRRGYVRDASERDLAVHLETALRGVIIGDRWPKSGVDVIITILEGEEDSWWGDEVTGNGGNGNWGTMGVLSGCITVAAAAIADAGIDCVDVVSGGVAALVRAPSDSTDGPDQAKEETTMIVLDPVPSEHREILAACVVGYLPSRDEITDLWTRGDLSNDYEELTDRAVQAAIGSHRILSQALKDAGEQRLKQ
jgi:exosome complex component MTR3